MGQVLPWCWGESDELKGQNSHMSSEDYILLMKYKTLINIAKEMQPLADNKESNCKFEHDIMNTKGKQRRIIRVSQRGQGQLSEKKNLIKDLQTKEGQLKKREIS